MRPTIRIRNVMRRAVQSWGSSSVKQALWNKEFAEGTWDHLAETPGDCVYRYIERYAQNGDILDLGCGSGNTGNEIASAAYRSYTGIDISDVAIKKAIRRSELSGRRAKNRYVQSDIATYVPQGTFSVILLRESLNYIPGRDVAGMLRRYRNYLQEHGTFIVRLYDRHRHEAIHRLIRRNFRVIEEFLPEDAPTIVVVFR